MGANGIIMTKFLSNFKKYAFTNQMMLFWLLGLLLAVQITFNFLWLAQPFNSILSALLIILYISLGIILLKLVSILENLDIERNQINAMIRSINDPAISYTTNFEIVLVNPAMEKFVNLSQKELKGKIITPELANNPHYGFLTRLIFPSLVPTIISRSVGSFPQKMKVQFYHPRELTLEIITTKVVGQNGRLYGFLKIIHNLTAEEMLKKTKSDFITVAAHQLRTPLSGLSWSLEMLLKKEMGPLNKEQEQILNQAKSAVQESLKTVEDLLSTAQITEGHFGFSFKKTDLINLIKEVFTKFVPAANKKNVKLILYPPDFKLTPFTMDPLRIKIVLETLVDNAIKYNITNGEVRIRINKLKDKPFIAISVEDTGQGIDPKDIPHLFTKFFRAETVMKKQTSGIGLGLYIAKNIVRGHGGDIQVRSVLGRGSVFTFTLPLDPSYLPPE